MRHPTSRSKQPKASRPGKLSPTALALALSLASLLPAGAQTYDWNQTAAGTGYNWNTNANWLPNTGFPNGPGQIANVNNDILGGQTIRLQQAITLGTLNYGDANGSHSFGISTGTGTNLLTFQSAAAGGGTAINLTGSGTASNSISVGVVLGGTSKLTISSLTQALTISGPISQNGNDIILNNSGSVSLTGAVSGGTVYKNGTGGLSFGSTTNFASNLVVNRGAVTMSSTGLANAPVLTVNGAYTVSGTVLGTLGGVVSYGTNSGIATNPGQRLPTGTVTLNSGRLDVGGQQATVGTANDWQMGLEGVSDTVQNLNVRSGFNFITMDRRANTTSTTLNVTNFTRSERGTVFLRGLAATSGTTVNLGLGNEMKFFAGNGNSLIVGANGGAGTTSAGVVPWIGSRSQNSSTSTIQNFTTYDAATGFRPLAANEQATYTTLNNATGTNENVRLTENSATSLTLSADKSVNSLMLSGATGNLGAGRTLTVASGGVFLQDASSSKSIGIAGDSAAGTLNFGAAEGIFLQTLNQTTTIGARITGTNGITVGTPSGVVILAGANEYSGKTTVNDGTLQVGGLFTVATVPNTLVRSSLGASDDVTVSNGGLLALHNDAAILDTATVRLLQNGDFNGRMRINSGIVETVGSLYLGDTLYTSGTFGAVGSGASFESDTWFEAGQTGMLMVIPVPEPGSAALIIGALGFATLIRRRRNS